MKTRPNPIDPSALVRGEAFVLRCRSERFDGLAVTFSSLVGGTEGAEACVGADLMDLVDRGLDDVCDSGGGIVVPTGWLVPA